MYKILFGKTINRLFILTSGLAHIDYVFSEAEPYLGIAVVLLGAFSLIWYEQKADSIQPAWLETCIAPVTGAYFGGLLAVVISRVLSLDLTLLGAAVVFLTWFLGYKLKYWMEEKIKKLEVTV